MGLSPGNGGFGDGVTLGVETALVGVVVDGLNFAVLVGVSVGTADGYDVVGLVLLVEHFLHFTGLAARDAVIGFETV